MTEYAEFKVSLRDVTPRIWRRFQIRYNATFLDLHEAIQDACGWASYHMFAFREGKRRGADIAGIPSEEWDEPVPDAKKVKIASCFRDGGRKKLLYEYDFGDSWEHDVVLRNVFTSDEKFHHRLLAGERAFPPEDCGSVPGYYRCVEVLEAGQNDPDDDVDLLEWIGNWRPDAFDLEAVKAAFDR